MANTVIALRSSGVTSNTPSLGVLANGELSLNFADGIIYYKTSSNTLGSIRTTQPAGLTTEVQFNDAGSFGANSGFTFSKVTGALTVKSISLTTPLAFSGGGANATSYTTGAFLTSNGTSFVSVANTGTSGTYGNAAYHPVITTDAYGRVSAVTNTLVQIAASQVTSGVLPFAQGGANATSYTTGGLLTSNGTAFVSVANTGTAGTYGNTTYVPVITTDAYGRVSSVTNTAITFPSATGTVTSVALSVPTFLTVTGSPVTTSGTLAVTLSGTALPITSGGTGGTTIAAAQAALQVDPLGTAVALAIALG